VVYLTKAGTFSSATADGAGLYPDTNPVGYKNSL
jgi:hypothetical protein